MLQILLLTYFGPFLLNASKYLFRCRVCLVLEIKANKDQRGRKAVEYLIHFQGWNSSWDRCVCEDYVLKDVEENRQLQRDLAEKAQLQLGAYLYRRERKKCSRKLSDKVNDSLEDNNGGEGETVDGDGSGSSGDESSCNLSQHDGNENCEDGEEEEEEEEEPTTPLSFDDMEEVGDLDDDDDKVPLQLSDTLKRILEHDHDLVNKKSKLISLPAEPNVVTILEGYLKHIAVNQLCGCSSEKPQCRYRSQHNIKALNIEKIRKTLVVCMEVLDGIRVYFDEALGTLLLYNNEIQQYQMVQNDPTIKQEQPEDYGDENMGNHAVKRELEENVLGDPEMEGPFPTNTYDTHNGDTDAGRKRLRSYRSSMTETVAHHSTNGFSKDQITRDEDSEDNFPLAQIKQELPNNNVHSSIASTSSRCSSPNGHGTNVTMSHNSTVASQTNKCDKMLNSVLAWHLVPDRLYNDKPVYASLVYGATHLARLFVKLPDLLSTSNMSEKRLKVVLHHLDNFLSYLEEHSEWFGESFYKDNLAT